MWFFKYFVIYLDSDLWWKQDHYFQIWNRQFRQDRNSMIHSLWTKEYINTVKYLVWFQTKEYSKCAALMCCRKAARKIKPLLTALLVRAKCMGPHLTKVLWFLLLFLSYNWKRISLNQSSTINLKSFRRTPKKWLKHLGTSCFFLN